MPPLESLPERFHTIAERCEAATKGPWEYVTYAAMPDGDDGILRKVGEPRGILGMVHGNDGEMLAHSRTDVPELLEALAMACKSLRYYASFSTMRLSRLGDNARETLAAIEKGDGDERQRRLDDERADYMPE